jgi:hypothetical protein
MRTAFYSGIMAGGLSLAVAFPALADISAQEVRDQLFGYYETFGYEVSVGSEEMSNGVLTITDLKVALSIPEEDSQIVIGITEFSLRETGDGAVAIEVPAAMANRVGFVDSGREVASAIVESKLVNYQGLVSGDVDNIRVQSTLDSMSMIVDSVNVGGGEFPVTLDLNFGALDSDYTIALDADDQRTISTDFDLASIDVVAAAAEPGGGDGFFSLTANVQDIVSSGDVSMKNVADMAENPLAIFGAGFLVDVAVELGKSNFDVAFKDRGTNFAATASSTGGLFDAVFSKDVIAYEIVQQGVDVTLNSSDIPFPSVKFAYDELAFGFEVPLAQSDEPSDFNINAALRGLTVGDPIWAMIDPGQTIPRDPATVAVEANGKVLVLVDLLDEEVLENLDDMAAPPMLPVSLDLSELLVSFGGALLEGDGAVTVDLATAKMIAGVPLPVGEVNLSLKGGFGLMDNLIGLGLIPPDASMGIRAMLGVFAKPMGDDHFETKVEFTPEGGILANGQRIQ